MIFTYTEKRNVPGQDGQTIEFKITRGFNMNEFLDFAYAEQDLHKEDGTIYKFKNLSVRLKSMSKELVEEDVPVTQGKSKGELTTQFIKKDVFVKHDITDEEAIEKWYEIVKTLK